MIKTSNLLDSQILFLDFFFHFLCMKTHSMMDKLVHTIKPQHESRFINIFLTYAR